MILNSSNFILTELEEMKSCINRVETKNTGVGLQLRWHFLLVMLFEKTVLSTSKRVCKLPFTLKLCKLYPILAPHIAGLRGDNSKNVIVKS